MTGRAGDVGAGLSATAQAFDAEISIADGEVLFYVVARTGEPDAAVRSAGGKVISRLHSSAHALALVPLSAHTQLQHHPDLALAGPVTIDPARFSRFTSLIGMGEQAPNLQPSTSSGNETLIHHKTGD